jgi:PAS domain S-box-containing protein
LADSLKVLVLEDNPSDAELVVSELRRSGLEFDWSREQDEQGYRRALGQPPDLILADYSLPQFNALEALRILQAERLDIPFIVITGTIEEAAIECMKLGAADYLLKDRLGRLGPAVDHALEQRRLRADIAAAAQQLKASEERFRSLFEQAPVGYQSLDESGCFLDVNQTWLDTTGRTRQEVIGRFFADFIGPDQISLFEERFAEFKDLGVQSGTVYTMTCKDGSSFVAEFHGRVKRDDDGSFERTHCAMYDITERVRAEEALRESEARYRRLAENAQDIIYRYRLEPDTAFEYVSPAAYKVLGYSPAEYYADQDLGARIVHPDDAHLEARAAITDEEPIVVRWLHRDGHVVWIEQRNTIIRDADSRPVAIEGIARDITASRELEQRKSDFTSMISHELRTPLTVIIGDATLLTRPEILSDPAKIAHTASQMLRRGQEMTRLVDDLLGVAKMQSSGLALSFAEVDITRDLANCARAVPVGRDHQLVVDIPSDLPRVVCDPDRLCYAVANLLRNAVKFSPEGGKIELQARAEKRMLEISVTDHGVGIPVEDQKRIFDRFTQADMSTTRPFGGFGLGLFISKSIAEAHEGRISVRSKPGKGSTFTIEIPWRPGEPGS